MSKRMQEIQHGEYTLLVNQNCKMCYGRGVVVGYFNKEPNANGQITAHICPCSSLVTKTPETAKEPECQKVT